MAKSPQPKKAAKKKGGVESGCESLRKLAGSLGDGEVRLYNLKKHTLPSLVQPPREKDLAACDWWLVHFPSRKYVAVPGGRGEALRLLKKLGEGKDELGWIPVPKPKAKTVKSSHARARVGVCEEDEPEKVKLTEVPASLDFDAAMKYAFPNQRIVHEIEKMMQAVDDVVIGGKVIATKPNWTARKEGVKFMIEHAQGRAGEKPPPPPEKKTVSWDELKGMIFKSPSARMVLHGLIEEAEVLEKNKKAVNPKVEPAAEGAAGA